MVLTWRVCDRYLLEEYVILTWTVCLRLSPPGSTCSSHVSYDTREARRSLPEVNGEEYC